MTQYLSYYVSADVVWLRIPRCGPGVALKRTPLMFTERNGHTFYLSLPFGWRLVFLKPWRL